MKSLIRTRLLSLTALIFLIGCSTVNMDKSFYLPNHPRYEIELDKQGRKHGRETWWFQNGNKKYEATNKEGIRDGEFSAWYQDGKLWYRGYELHGQPESTLTYFFPSGNLKSEAAFRAGIQVERKDYDESGKLMGATTELLRPGNQMSSVDIDSGRAGLITAARKVSLQIWATRVRQAVENYWVLPKEFLNERPYRAVASIKVSKDGKILGVAWLEKSPSATFNSLAARTFKKIKRLPAFPPEVTEMSLEIEYEFISLGKPIPRKKLEVIGESEISNSTK